MLGECSTTEVHLQTLKDPVLKMVSPFNILINHEFIHKR